MHGNELSVGDDDDGGRMCVGAKLFVLMAVESSVGAATSTNAELKFKQQLWVGGW